jgi:hypothetical protein
VKSSKRIYTIDNYGFSVMPDLLRHPEKQLLEFTWIPVRGSSPGEASPE